MPLRPSRRRVLSWAAALPAAFSLCSRRTGAAHASPAASESDSASAPSMWNDLTDRQRALINGFLPSAEGKWTLGQPIGYYRRAGTRSAVYAAIGLLVRNANEDRHRALRLIDESLRWQFDARGERDHGNWPRGPRTPVVDPNWREFVGLGLIVLRERFANVLGPERRDEVDVAITRAGMGSAKRRVPFTYTNIALMNALLVDYTAGMTRRDDLSKISTALGRTIGDEFDRYGTLAEFNSPTYAGVDLLTLAMWRQFAHSPEMRERGAEMEQRLWRQAADFYHPGLRNLCGPYWRSYGMDMTGYQSLAGLAITNSLPLDEPAPWPTAEATGFNHLLAYSPLFALAPPALPDGVEKKVRQFEGRRRIEHTVRVGDERVEVVAMLEPHWMMGAASGLPIHRDQHRPATIHWRATAEGHVGWLAAAGDPGVQPRIVGDELEVALDSAAKTPQLRLWIHAPGLDPREFGEDRWQLPGMEIGVSTRLAQPTIHWFEAPRLGRVVEVAWPSTSDAKVTLSPSPVVV